MELKQKRKQKHKSKKRNRKYTEQDSHEDASKLELLLIGLESIPLLRRQIHFSDGTINKANLIWLNHNLSISNKHNVKLVETLKLIQRILKRLD